jgi:hypothetical protein
MQVSIAIQGGLKRMAETKYEKYFVKEPVLRRGGFFPVLVTNGARDFEGAGFSLRLHYIAEPGTLIKEPHRHDFEQFYFITGADLANVDEFKAEVHFSIGEEGEKHIITAPTAVHLPVGLVHGPLEFKKVDSPLIFIDALLSAEYSTK